MHTLRKSILHKNPYILSTTFVRNLYQIEILKFTLHKYVKCIRNIIYLKKVSVQAYKTFFCTKQCLSILFKLIIPPICTHSPNIPT